MLPREIRCWPLNTAFMAFVIAAAERATTAAVRDATPYTQNKPYVDEQCTKTALAETALREIYQTVEV